MFSPERLLSLAFAISLLPSCNAFLLLGEKGLADCATTGFEELEKQQFRLRRRLEKAAPELPISLRVYRDCRIDPGADTRALGVKEMYFRNPRSASPELVLVLDTATTGESIAECSTIFRLGENLVFACPEGFYYELLAEP